MARPREHTHDEFIDVAIRIVDEEGLDALTLRRLGAEVGVSFTAMYTYFPSRDHLIDALVDRMAAEIIAEMEWRGDSVRDQLVAVAMSSRRALNRHPRLTAAFLASTAPTPGGSSATMSVVALLERAGLTGVDLVRAYRIIESYVFGASIFDFGAAPEHFSIRRRRYHDTGHPAFRTVATSDEAIGAHNDEAFLHGFDLLLSALGI
jgi:AcrR family transcriptional regulator